MRAARKRQRDENAQAALPSQIEAHAGSAASSSGDAAASFRGAAGVGDLGSHPESKGRNDARTVKRHLNVEDMSGCTGRIMVPMHDRAFC